MIFLGIFHAVTSFCFDKTMTEPYYCPQRWRNKPLRAYWPIGSSRDESVYQKYTKKVAAMKVRLFSYNASYLLTSEGVGIEMALVSI